MNEATTVTKIEAKAENVKTHRVKLNYLQMDSTVNEITVEFNGNESWPEGSGGLNIAQMIVKYLSHIVKDPEFVGFKASLNMVDGNRLVSNFQPYIK